MAAPAQAAGLKMVVININTEDEHVLNRLPGKLRASLVVVSGVWLCLWLASGMAISVAAAGDALRRRGHLHRGAADLHGAPLSGWPQSLSLSLSLSLSQSLTSPTLILNQDEGELLQVRGLSQSTLQRWQAGLSTAMLLPLILSSVSETLWRRLLTSSLLRTGGFAISFEDPFLAFEKEQQDASLLSIQSPAPGKPSPAPLTYSPAPSNCSSAPSIQPTPASRRPPLPRYVCTTSAGRLQVATFPRK